MATGSGAKRWKPVMRAGRAPRRKRPLRPKPSTTNGKWYSDFGDLLNLPDTVHMGGLLQKEAVSVLHGHSGSLKSFMALAIASSVAYGLPILPGGKRCKRGLVLYLAFEDPKGYKARRIAWLNYHELPMQGLQVDALKIVNPLPEDVGDMPGLDFDLQSESKVTRLIEYAEGLAKATRLPLALIVVDVVRDACLGVESTRTFRLAGENARRIAKRIKCHVMLLHHNTKRTEEMRGPANLETYIQQRFLLQRMGPLCSLHIMKNREGPTGVTLAARAHKITTQLVPRQRPTESLAIEFIGTESELEPTYVSRLQDVAEAMELDSHVSEAKLLQILGWSRDGRGGMQRRMLRDAVPVKQATVHLGGDDYRRLWRENVRGRWVYYCQTVDASEGKVEAEATKHPKPSVEPEVAATMARKKKGKGNNGKGKDDSTET